jgi:hypothetical protein
MLDSLRLAAVPETRAEGGEALPRLHGQGTALKKSEQKNESPRNFRGPSFPQANDRD